ncbi:MAG: hypothetical protein NT027_06630, partial [Proteobacteria bacterium]|nr:hypothetical protein [Pseudomonadota bacterium]
MNMEDLVSASTLGYTITIAVLSVLTLLGVAVFLLFGGKLQTNLLVWIGIGICLLVVVATLGGIFMSSDRTIRYEPSTRTLFVFANRFTKSESETFKLSSSSKIRIKPVKYRAILHVVSIVDSVGF